MRAKQVDKSHYPKITTSPNNNVVLVYSNILPVSDGVHSQGVKVGLKNETVCMPLIVE